MTHPGVGALTALAFVLIKFLDRTFRPTSNTLASMQPGVIRLSVVSWGRNK